MIRKILTILSLIGLLLSVGLWGMSYYGVTYKNASNTAGKEVFAVHGMLWLFMWTGGDVQHLLPIIPRGWTFGDVPDYLRVHSFIPWFGREVYYGTVQFSSLFLPLYIPVLMLALASTFSSTAEEV